MASKDGKLTGGMHSSGAGERAPAPPPPRRKGASPARKRSAGAGFDPASSPEGGPSLADEAQRQFHATHFTADPRGSAMAGAPPGRARRKSRGGTPPDSPEPRQPAKTRKRRGGAGPE
jgi:hypothetical protein